MTLMSILLGTAQGRVAISLTASGNNYDIYTNRGALYAAGRSDITVTVPGTIGSSSTGAYAMLVPNAFNPADTVTIVNNGVIQGAGGAGGAGGNAPGTPNGRGPGSPGFVGGNAVYVNRPVVITNNGTIAGGGGGGGGGQGVTGIVSPKGVLPQSPGGGGGGGAGTIGGAGGPSPTGPSRFGAPGTSTAGGAGGPGGTAGGPGGGRGAAGTASSGSGGAAGNYIVGNPFVTWPATGTRQGGVA